MGNVKRFDGEKMKYMMQVNLLTKKNEKQEAKLRHMREMIECAQQHSKKRITVGLINDIYVAPTEDKAQKCIALIPLEKDEDTDDEGEAGGSKFEVNIAAIKEKKKLEKKQEKEVRKTERQERKEKRTERRNKRLERKTKREENKEKGEEEEVKPERDP